MVQVVASTKGTVLLGSLASDMLDVRAWMLLQELQPPPRAGMVTCRQCKDIVVTKSAVPNYAHYWKLLAAALTAAGLTRDLEEISLMHYTSMKSFMQASSASFTLASIS